MNAQPESNPGTKALAAIGILAIVFFFVALAVYLIQQIIPTASDSPATVIESQDRPERPTRPEPEVAEEEEDFPFPRTPEYEEEDDEPLAQPPVTQQPYVYVPQSNPNGYADLQINVQSIGFISGGTIFQSPVIDSNLQGGLQLAVRNIGTRTSDTWDVDIELPNGERYEIDTQAGLRPNEVSVITIGFDSNGRDGTYDYSARVNSRNEINTNNNYVRNTMTFID